MTWADAVVAVFIVFFIFWFGFWVGYGTGKKEYCPTPIVFCTGDKCIVTCPALVHEESR